MFPKLAFEKCKICGKVNGNSVHLKNAHGVTWEEYLRAAEDDAFLEELKKREAPKLKRARARKNVLMLKWFQAPMIIKLINARISTVNAPPVVKTDNIDISDYADADEVEVDDLQTAEKLANSGWECKSVITEGQKKKYVMIKK